MISSFIIFIAAILIISAQKLYGFQSKVNRARCTLHHLNLIFMQQQQETITTSIAITNNDKPSLGVRVADRVLSSAFKIKPLFKMASKKARAMMIQRGGQIGADWEGKKQFYESKLDLLQNELQQLQKPSLQYPSYYLQPFHAYDEGNLSWQAAMEVESAALTVHAQLFTSDPTELDPLGDFHLRNNFHINLRNVLQEQSPTQSLSAIKKIVDIGCSTGLSTWKLVETFPEAEIVGVDLSPYMLAVAKFDQQYSDKLPASAKQHVSFLHGAGEDIATTLQPNTYDLVSISLVSHELPELTSANIMQQAYNVLKPGGVFAFMDMDPGSPAFQRVLKNPFAFAAFKSTEPWLQEYVRLDLLQALKETGFSRIFVLANSPRHRTIVAYK